MGGAGPVSRQKVRLDQLVVPGGANSNGRPLTVAGGDVAIGPGVAVVLLGPAQTVAEYEAANGVTVPVGALIARKG